MSSSAIGCFSFRDYFRLSACVGQFGQIAAGYAAQFGADRVRGETGAQQAAVNSGDLALIERTANVREPSLQPRANEFGFAGLGEYGFEGGLNVPVRNAACAELASNAEAALSSGIGVLAREFERVAAIIEVVLLAKARDHAVDSFFLGSAALQAGSHLVDRVRATHQRAERGGIKLLLGGELARR
jgi:hypothetical protein